jgi:hypothetical protein
MNIGIVSNVKRMFHSNLEKSDTVVSKRIKNK